MVKLRVRSPIVSLLDYCVLSLISVSPSRTKPSSPHMIETNVLISKSYKTALFQFPDDDDAIAVTDL